MNIEPIVYRLLIFKEIGVIVRSTKNYYAVLTITIYTSYLKLKYLQVINNKQLLA